MSEETKADLYGNAIAYIHPQVEDFGITAVEAMAAGNPVIAFGKGGATETVANGVTEHFWRRSAGEDIGNAVIRDLIRPCFRHPSSARTPNPMRSKISRNHARVHRIRTQGKEYKHEILVDARPLVDPLNGGVTRVARGLIPALIKAMPEAEFVLGTTGMKRPKLILRTRISPSRNKVFLP